MLEATKTKLSMPQVKGNHILIVIIVIIFTYSAYLMQISPKAQVAEGAIQQSLEAQSKQLERSLQAEKLREQADKLEAGLIEVNAEEQPKVGVKPVEEAKK